MNNHIRQNRNIFMFFSWFLLLAFLSADASSQINSRKRLNIPDISGFKTLICDFHMHTVFSDGSVWPNIRVIEAWREGLDVISITDHIEYQPHEENIPKDHNAAYKKAFWQAKALDIMLIQGTEITRDMPPGHFNALFIKDASPMDVENWKEAIKTAVDQGAFIMWNHPGWAGQQPDEIPKWYDDHTYLLKNKMLHGIEIVNYNEYYPLVQKWCLEKKLTMFGNSDIHYPSGMAYDLENSHRPYTLVFAKEKSIEAVKEALFTRRTAVCFNELLIGEEKFLGPLYDNSVEVLSKEVFVTGRGGIDLRIRNNSSFDMKLVLDSNPKNISAQKNVTLYGNRTVLIRISSTKEDLAETKKVEISYKIRNFLIEPEKGLPVRIPVTVTFKPKPPEKK